MAPQRKTKRSLSRNTSPRPSVVLTKGDWLDVMDHDGVWNVARVLSVPSPEEVEVMYDGWPEEYDEIVRVDSDRVAPYHTFTWAVKCWVKYLNWPMWPSVITIRTPGTADGIKNLAMENRLYVDFLDNASFAKRDRCWQMKRQVKMIDDDYDKKRMGTNGAQFEGALEALLKSDATTKMPTFAKGTLPLQYENSTTESVGQMRKIMGNGLWYRNFANNKARHMRSHIYETIGDDNDIEDPASDEAVPVPKLKVRRPIMSTINEERKQKPQKQKRPFRAQNAHVTVKIEQEPLAEVEDSNEVEEMERSDDQEDTRERKIVLSKKRRLPVKRRSAVPPVAKRIMPSQKGKNSTSSEDTNAAPTMPRHVTVMMDEIIVDDDDDSGSGEVNRRKLARTTGTMPRKFRTSSTPTRAKEERDELTLVASPKPSHSSRVYDDDDWEDEEKGVLGDAVDEVRRHELPPKKSVIWRRSKQCGDSKQGSGGVAHPQALTQSKASRRSKISLPLIEQRIAFAKEVLRDLDKEKQEAIKDIPPKDPLQTSKSSISSDLHNKSQTNLPRAKRIKDPPYQPEGSGMSFLRVDDKEKATPAIFETRPGKIAEIPIDFDLHSNQVDHSFLSFDEAYSTDSQESKGVPTRCDERLAIDTPSEPKQTKRARKSEAKSLVDMRIGVSGIQLVGDKSNDEVSDASEEKQQEVRRHFCVMQADLEGALESSEDDKTKSRPSKKTVISVPRKFDVPVEEVSHVVTSSTDSMLRIKPPPPFLLRDSGDRAVFSSSEGFSMENWFKRTLSPKYKSTKT